MTDPESLDLDTDPMLGALVLLVSVSLALVYVNLPRKPPLPPGPPKPWLLGSNFPRTGVPYLVFEDWTLKYGPIFSLKQGWNDVIVIGRHDAAVDILEKEGAKTMDRPRSISIAETLCRDMRLLTMGVSDRLKKYRRIIQAQLQARSIKIYQPYQVSNAINLLNDLLDNPSQHQEHAKRYAASVIITLTYGKPTTTSYSDPLIQKILFYTGRFGRVVRPGTYWVDSLPFLQYVPGYLSELRRWHVEELNFYQSIVDVVLAKMRRNEELRPCFVKNMHEKQAEYKICDAEVAFLSGGLFIAGADTSASAISIMMMASACFQDAQDAVYTQIDAIVGKHRYPTLEDEPALTQVSAFVLECFRWRPVSAGGFAHRTTEDIIWRGYRIPAGATIIPNIWSMTRSPEVFPDPEKFDHGRWLTKDGKLRDDLKSYNFGFGRRVCPGQQLAHRSLFITTAMVLWAFRVSQDKDCPIDTHAFTQTANIHPLPFSLVFEPRMPSDDLRYILKSV